MVKRLVFTPIVWNENNYKGPLGIKKTGNDFVAQYGYGYEEWNNRDRCWQGQKIFFTQSIYKLLKSSKDGGLGMVMIAANNSKQYAVGIACGIEKNTEKEKKQIAEFLVPFGRNSESVWQLPLVQKCFKNDKDKFIAHWKENYLAVGGRCPTELYYWFDKPIALDPCSITGKKQLVREYTGFQYAYPQTVWEIIDDHIPAAHKIRDWLSSDDFDDKKVNYEKKQFPKGMLSGSSNKPTDEAYVKYMKEAEIIVHPKHAELQKSFVKYLRKNGVNDILEDIVDIYIDVLFCCNGSDFIVEVKPSEEGETKYPIRAAIGQVLEYRYNYNKSAVPVIVLGCEPSEEEKEFVKSLKIVLSWPKSDSSDDFEWIEP